MEGSMLKEKIQNKLEEEINKLREQQSSDINGKRVISNFQNYVDQNIENLLKMQDGQEVLSSAINLFKNSPSIVSEIVLELNSRRREQAAKVTVLREVLQELEKDALEEKQISEKREVTRNIGERPDSLKATRNSQESESESESESVEEQQED